MVNNREIACALANTGIITMHERWQLIKDLGPLAEQEVVSGHGHSEAILALGVCAAWGQIDSGLPQVFICAKNAIADATDQQIASVAARQAAANL
jgi:Ni,Fe-hydrogenase I small subunit